MPSSAPLKTVHVTFQNKLWLQGKGCTRTLQGQFESGERCFCGGVTASCVGTLRTNYPKQSAQVLAWNLVSNQ